MLISTGQQVSLRIRRAPCEWLLPWKRIETRELRQEARRCAVEGLRKSSIQGDLGWQASAT